MDLSWPWGCPQHPTACHPQPHIRGGMVSELTPCRLGSDPWGSLALIPCTDLCCFQTHADPGRCPEVFGRAAFRPISLSGPELAPCLWQGEHTFWEKRGSAAVSLSVLSLVRARKTQLQSPNYYWTQQQCNHSKTLPLGILLPWAWILHLGRGHHHLHWVSTELSAFLTLQMWTAIQIIHFW